MILDSNILFKCGKCRKLCKDVITDGCSCGSHKFIIVFRNDAREKAMEIVNAVAQA